MFPPLISATFNKVAHHTGEIPCSREQGYDPKLEPLVNAGSATDRDRWGFGRPCTFLAEPMP
jgi:hypothetical protein